MHLGLRDMAQRKASDLGESRYAPRHGADPESQRQFSESMSQSSETAQQAPQTALPAGPFALFASAVPAPAVHEGVIDSLREMVGRLLVDDSGNGSLRIDLADDVMPGVAVSVREDAGAWLAEFHCRVEASFIRLAEPAQEMARALAAALSRDAVWRVVADGLPPGGRWQTMADDRDGQWAVEAFASSLGRAR